MSYSQRWMRLLAFLPIFFLAQCDWGHIGYNTGYKPEQPLPFSHKLHAGEYQVSCVYCHTQVEQANHAAVPSLNICMNCHMMVATESPHIQKLAEKYRSGETVNWVKVHMLPDHVKFNHKRHVHRFSTSADRYQACKNCHGEVKNMEVVEQVSSLSMGWCVNCHREPDGYHTGAPPSSKDLKKLKGPKGNTNCSTCHQ